MTETPREEELFDLLHLVLGALYMDVKGRWQVAVDAEPNVDYVQERFHELDPKRDEESW